MALINEHFLKLQNNYLFSDIAKKVNSFKVTPVSYTHLTLPTIA